MLALDLEGTLVSNAMSQIPRPGLYAFLERCKCLFPRIVMLTTVEQGRFRQIAVLLVEEGYAPPWFSEVEYSHGREKPKTLGSYRTVVQKKPSSSTTLRFMCIRGNDADGSGRRCLITPTQTLTRGCP